MRPAPWSPRCRRGSSPPVSVPRRSVIGGLLLLGVSSLVFGFGKEIFLLDAARFTAGRRRGADLVRRADLVDHQRSRREPRLGDRDGAGDRGRRRPARPGDRRPRRRSRHRASLRLGHGADARLRLRRLPASPSARVPAEQSLREVFAAMLSRPVLTADRLRRRPLADVRRGRGPGAAADRRSRRGPRADRGRVHRRRRAGGGAGARSPAATPIGSAGGRPSWSG